MCESVRPLEPRHSSGWVPALSDSPSTPVNTVVPPFLENLLHPLL